MLPIDTKINKLLCRIALTRRYLRRMALCVGLETLTKEQRPDRYDEIRLALHRSHTKYLKAHSPNDPVTYDEAKRHFVEAMESVDSHPSNSLQGRWLRSTRQFWHEASS